jgi:hypothetical protein
MHAIRTGQTLTFAPFSMSQQGINNGHESLSWSQVQAVDVNQGYVRIKKTGMSKSWGTASVAKIPNFLVFIVIAQEMMQQAKSR